MAFTIKQGDRRPLFVVALKDNVGEEGEAAVDLTTATGGAFFNMRTVTGGTVIINRGSAAISLTPTDGVVTYSWGTADVATAGEYEAEMEIVWNDGKKETFPNDSYWTVTITDDIA